MAVATTTPAAGTRTVILVEGVSDQLALETLAQRRGRNLKAEDVAVVPIGGATNIGRALTVYGPAGARLRRAGLCDPGEEDDFRRPLDGRGLRVRLTCDGPERLGL